MRADSDKGAAYVYEKGVDWASATETKLSPSDAGGNFGSSVSVNGDAIIVGAYQYFLGGRDGKAYIYEDTGTGWAAATETILTGSDPPSNDLMGQSVALLGDRAIVGASANHNGSDPGRAYIIEKGDSGWAETAVLVASDATSGDRFGSGVAFGGDYAMVAAQIADAAYVFESVPVLPGDANVDGTVNEDDAAILAANWLMQTGAIWTDGDFNEDGKVNDADATMMATNWQGSEVASVPEPMTLAALLALVPAGLLAYRRR